MRRIAALLFVPSLIWCATPRYSQRVGPVNTAKEAKSIAEQGTQGIAVSARRIHLNGASGGWEVEVHMPKEDRGWRCTIDCDTRGIRNKDRIPNPKAPKGHR